MNCPPIQYCRTTDGVSIAYWTLGEGPTVLIVDVGAVSHVALEWEVPAFQRFFLRLAETFRVVRYNPRCSGLSECPEDVSLPAFVLDLVAVVTALGPDPVALLSIGHGSNYTNQFSADHPDRVAALASFIPVVDNRKSLAYFTALLHGAPGWGEQVMANLYDPQQSEPHEPLETLFRNASSHQERVGASRLEFELVEPLARIRAPTLVLHDQQNPFSAGPEMASRVPDARLVVRSSDGYPPWYDDDQDGLFDLLVPFFLEHAASTEDAPAASTEPARTPTAVSRLSPRELEVLRHIADGTSNPEIGEELVISPGTVARHVTNILNKTGCRNRADAARFAAEHGLTTPDVRSPPPR